MGWFDAVNHAMSASATGGFSTRNASLAYFQSPLIEYMTCLFMFIGGTNFTLIYFGFKGRFDKLYRNEEFRVFMFVVLFFVILVALSIYFIQGTAHNTTLPPPSTSLYVRTNYRRGFSQWTAASVDMAAQTGASHRRRQSACERLRGRAVSAARDGHRI